MVFLAWDNTDLTPARRMVEFKKRFKLMSSTLLFHLGFGILFLIPGLNILFLSFAPVGATLYFIENQMGGENKHEKLAPSMSSLILISHVKDGVELFG